MVGPDYFWFAKNIMHHSGRQMVVKDTMSMDDINRIIRKKIGQGSGILPQAKYLQESVRFKQERLNTFTPSDGRKRSLLFSRGRQAGQVNCMPGILQSKAEIKYWLGRAGPFPIVIDMKYSQLF